MKTAIVTGAFGNLGQAVVKKFIDEGYFVAGTVMSHDRSGVDFPADRFEKYIMDLTNEEETQKFIESVISKHGSIDAAILTAGGFAMGKITDTKASNILDQYKMNFETAYNVARPVFTQMLQQNNGKIFMVGSKAGLDSRNGKGVAAYSLTKSLIFRLAELMNDEAKGKNVVTHVIVPSTIDTPQNREAMPDAKFDNWVKAEAIAQIIYRYCTDEFSVVREPVIKVYSNA